MESVRRDVVPLVRVLMDRVLHALLVERNMPAAVDITKATIRDVLSDAAFPLYDYVVTKALWRGVDSTQYGMKLAHIAFAEKMRRRHPSRAIVLGQRVSYVFVQAEKGAKQWQQTEDPFYVLSHSLPLDLDLYVSSYVQKPLVRLFALPGLMGSAEKATKALFTGEHMRSVKKAGPSVQTGLGAFFKKQEGARCSHCKRPITTPAAGSKAPSSASAPGQKKLGFFGAKPAAASSTAPASSAAASSSSSSASASKSLLGSSHGLCESCAANPEPVLLARVADYANKEAEVAALNMQW